jgi:AcrR family transcriptional regulator
MEFNDKQTAIIDTAEKLFSVSGFDGTSVRDIAHEAGVNVAMISYYFGSKEKLMEAVFEHKSNKMRLKVENLIQDTNMVPLQKIYLLIDEYVEKFLEQKNFHMIMMREQLTEKQSPVADMIMELKLRNLESIKLLIQDGQKKGMFKKNIDITMMMGTMIGTVSQMLLSQPYYRRVHNMEEVEEKEFRQHIKKKLSVYLKKLFKVLLTNEA